MNIPRQILIFSDVNIDAKIISRYDFLNEKPLITYFSKENDFIKALGHLQYDLVIIFDRTKSSLTPAFTELVKQNCHRSTPILLYDQKPELVATEKNMKSDHGLTIKKLTLKRLGENQYAGEKNEDMASAVAANLCHEINNPLMAITANVEVLKEKCRHLPSDITAKIDSIYLAANRIKAATHGLIEKGSLNKGIKSSNKRIGIDYSDKCLGKSTKSDLIGAEK